MHLAKDFLESTGAHAGTSCDLCWNWRWQTLHPVMNFAGNKPVAGDAVLDYCYNRTLRKLHPCSLELQPFRQELQPATANGTTIHRRSYIHVRQSCNRFGHVTTVYAGDVTGSSASWLQARSTRELQPTTMELVNGLATSDGERGSNRWRGECYIHSRRGLRSSMLHPWPTASYARVAGEARDAGVVGDVFPVR